MAKKNIIRNRELERTVARSHARRVGKVTSSRFEISLNRGVVILERIGLKATRWYPDNFPAGSANGKFFFCW